MSVPQNKKIACPKCGGENNLRIYNSVNVVENPKLRENILNGRMFNFFCDLCGHPFMISYPVLYSDIKKEFMVYYYPETTKNQIGERFFDIEAQDKYAPIRKRLTSTYNEFREKIVVMESGLNDMAVEVTKAVLAEAAAKNTDSEVNEGYFSLYDKEQKIIGYTFFVGEENKKIVRSVDMEIYRRSQLLVKRLAKKERNTKSFIRIDHDWAEKIMERYEKYGSDDNS